MPVTINWLRNPLTTVGDTIVQGPNGAALRFREFNVQAFGATGDGSSDDSTAIQTALTAAAGAIVFFPQPSSYYKITVPLTVSAGTTFLLDPGCIIEQTTKYNPVFDILDADGVTIQGNGALLRYTGSRTFTSSGSFRGEQQYAYGAGVWTNSDRTHVSNLRVEGFTEGVYLSGWTGAAQTNYAAVNNVIADLVVNTVDFGVLMSGQSDVTLRGIRGTSVVSPSSTNPSHLIYISHAARCRQVAISDCEAWDIADSAAYQIKGVDGGTVKNLAARNCAGLMNLATGTGDDNYDLTFSNIHGRDMASSGGNGCIFMGANNHRVKIDGLSIHQATSDRAIRLDGTDCALSNVVVRARHDSQADTYDVAVLGTRNTIDGISIVNIQDDGSDYATAWRSILLSTSTDCVIRPLTILNTRIGVELISGATNPTIDLSGAKFTLAATSGLQRLLNASTTLRVISGDLRVSADVGNAAKTLTVLSDETTQRWNTALTADRAVTLSTTGAYRGAKWRIVREASATGAFNLNVGTGPLKALGSAGTWCEVEYDGSAWRLTASGSL